MLVEEITLHDILSINIHAAEILAGSSLCGSKKFDESVSITSFTGSQFSYCHKSILKSPRRKVILF